MHARSFSFWGTAEVGRGWALWRQARCDEQLQPAPSSRSRLRKFREALGKIAAFTGRAVTGSAILVGVSKSVQVFMV